MGRIAGGTPGTLSPGQGLYEVSTEPIHRIGETYRDDQRTFIYGQAATAIAAGLLAASDQSIVGADNELADGSCIALAAGLTHQDQPTITANLAVGDFWLCLYHASELDNMVVNALQDGFICLSDSTATTGMDRIYEIEWNSAIYDQGTTDAVTIKLKDAITVATIDTATAISFVQHPGKELVLFATGTDDNPIGAPQTAVANNEFAWFQTWGYGMGVSATDTAFAGTTLQAKDTGAVEIRDQASTLPSVANGLCNVATAGDAMVVNWKIMR